jgi:hypothetical protein
MKNYIINANPALQTAYTQREPLYRRLSKGGEKLVRKMELPEK